MERVQDDGFYLIRVGGIVSELLVKSLDRGMNSPTIAEQFGYGRVESVSLSKLVALRTM